MAGFPQTAPALTCMQHMQLGQGQGPRGGGLTKPLWFAEEAPSGLHVSGTPSTGGKRVSPLPNPLPVSPGSLPAYAGALQYFPWNWSQTGW